MLTAMRERRLMALSGSLAAHALDPRLRRLEHKSWFCLDTVNAELHLNLRFCLPTAQLALMSGLFISIDKIFWQKKRLFEIQGKIWSRRIPAFTVHWKFLGFSWAFTQVEIILLDFQKCFAGSRTKAVWPQWHISQHLSLVNVNY